MRNVLLIALCLTTGCAAPPPGSTLGRTGERTLEVQGRSGTVAVARVSTDNRTRSEELAVGFDDAWARLPQVLSELGLSIGSVDEAGGRISHSGERVNRVAGKRMSIYLNCGTGTTAQPYANLYAVSLGYEVLVTENGTGSVLAEMRIEATARPRDVSGNAVVCTSKGTLEQLVFDGILAAR